MPRRLPHERSQRYYFTADEADLLTILKNTHFYPEFNSTFWKFETFVSQAKVPGERFFGVFLAVWLLCTPIANAQPWTAWKVPDTLGRDGWRVNLSRSTVLLSSSHSNWLYAYSNQGGLIWKRPLSWPWNDALTVQGGLWKIQQEGQPAILLQPETGELMQRQGRDFPGWTVPLEGKSCLRLGPEGQLLTGSNDWLKWHQLTQLRLDQGDSWWGPPVISGSAAYVGTTRGQLQRVELASGQTRRAPPIRHPLLPPQSYPDGVMEVSLDGYLTVIRGKSTWLGHFPGWSNCYGSRGQILARPAVDDQGRVYLATRQSLQSWDATGKLRWSLKLACDSPVYWQQKVCFVADSSPALLLLSADSGALLQRVALPAAAESGPAVEFPYVALALHNAQVVVIRSQVKP